MDTQLDIEYVKARKLARRVVDEGPSYPDPRIIFCYLREAVKQGLVTLHFELPSDNT